MDKKKLVIAIGAGLALGLSSQSMAANALHSQSAMKWAQNKTDAQKTSDNNNEKAGESHDGGSTNAINSSASAPAAPTAPTTLTPPTPPTAPTTLTPPTPPPNKSDATPNDTSSQGQTDNSTANMDTVTNSAGDPSPTGSQ